MGLDMYLTIKKKEYVSKYYNKNGISLEYPKEITDFIKCENLALERETSYEVGYWRKANAIHGWFVNNCGDGVDDCSVISVGLDDLEKLLLLCETVLKEPGEAPNLLPTRQGFFFGSYDYDEWYFEQIEDTINIIKPVIEFMKHNKDNYDYSVEYQASW
jgi:hypothetical protein